MAPDLLGLLALHLDRVDRDDPRRAGDARALDDGLADAAAADDRDGRAGVHLRGVERGADAGGDAAADQRELVVGDARVDLDDRRLVARHRLGERAEAGHGRVVGAVGALAAVAHHDLELGVAEVRLVVQAEPADAARGDERRDDLVALVEAGDVLADLDDRARALVAEDRAGHDADVAVLQRQVGVADAAGAELDDDVARPGGAGSMFSIESGPPVSVNTAARMGFLLDLRTTA